MTISRRIMLMLTIAILALLGVGAGGMWQLNQSQFRFTYVENNTFPSIKTLQGVRDAFGQMRRQIGLLMTPVRRPIQAGEAAL